MSLLRANGIPVAEAVITLPITGRGVAEVLLASPKGPGPGEAVNLEWEEGRAQNPWRFTAVRGGRLEGFWRALLVQGRGGLDRVLEARFYQDMPGYLIAQAIISEAGEEPGTLDYPDTLPRYVRMRGTAMEQLNALLLRSGRVWWVGTDGRVNVGPTRARGEYGGAAGVAVAGGEPGAGHYALELSPELVPGVKLKGSRDGGPPEVLGLVTRVVHRVGARELKTEVWTV